MSERSEQGVFFDYNRPSRQPYADRIFKMRKFQKLENSLLIGITVNGFYAYGWPGKQGLGVP